MKLEWTAYELLIELKRLMVYDPETGLFTRKISSSSRAQAGAIAGNLGTNGYWHICILSQNYTAHRLAWLYVHGEFPASQLDHKNRVKHDNRLANLRLATPKQNGENQSLSLVNTSGARGVTWRSDTCKWQAQIHHHKRCHYLGCFSTIAEAKAAYAEAASKFFTHYPGA